jgi:DNA-binding transcriptional ArsR family regulator
LTNERIFIALADNTRRHLLINLAKNSPRTATQLSEDYDFSRPNIIKHLNVLKEAGLVTVHQQGREKRYTLTPEPLSELEGWIQELNAIWDARLLRLKDFIEGEDKGPK